MPCYSSSVYWDTPEGAAAQARAFVDQGFRAFKVKVGLEVENDIASLHAIRDEVGYEVDMLVDANQCYTRHLALRVGRELEKLKVPFFEEPLSIDDVDGHALLADKLDVRIATGENMYTRWDFLPFFQKQADPRRAGRRVPLRWDQRGQADRRPRRRAPPARDPAHLLRRADDRGKPPRRRRVVERADHRVRPDVQRDPGEARQESACSSTTVSSSCRPSPARRRDRLGLRRRPPVHGRDRDRRRLAARLRARDRGDLRPDDDLAGVTLSPGVHSVLVTPFAADESLDEASLRTLVDYYVAAGVAGVLALGVLGEADKLSDAERERVQAQCSSRPTGACR